MNPLQRAVSLTMTAALTLSLLVLPAAAVPEDEDPGPGAHAAEEAELPAETPVQQTREESPASAPDQSPDLVYLDPMFPARRKSGLVKKKFQLLHLLEPPCEDEEDLLDAALAARPRRIIVKRPLKGPYLGGLRPGYSISGKTIRYDCIVPPQAGGRG